VIHRAIPLVLMAALPLATACTTRTVDPASATGTLEYTETEVASIVPGRVVRVQGREGDSVRAGDTLVVIAQATVLSSDLAGRRARISQAEARLRDLQAGPRASEIARLEDELRGFESEVERTQRDAQRLTALVDSGNITRQQAEAAQSAARVAAARRDAARDALRTLREGARPEQIEAARGEIAVARAALDAGVAGIRDLTVSAPVSGVIISRHVEEGEVVGAGMSLMTIGDVTHPYVRVYVGQQLLSSIQRGDEVTGTIDPAPNTPHKGRVVAINTTAEFTPRVALTRDERADLLFGVRVEFAGGDRALKAGMPITVHFPRAAASPPPGR
jgi:HlyD family secretion protein